MLNTQGPCPWLAPGWLGRPDESRSARNARREVRAATSSWPQRAVALVAVCNAVSRGIRPLCAAVGGRQRHGPPGERLRLLPNRRGDLGQRPAPV